jgi:hypothetical protein
MARNHWGSQPSPRGRRRFDLEPAKPVKLPARRRVVLEELPPVVLTGGGQKPRLLEPPTPSPRPVAAELTICPECGRRPGLNRDGTFRAHRPEADVFVGPYCPGGRPKGRQ